MLGKNSRAVYLNEFLQDQVEDIKKVDYVNKIIVLNPVEGGIS